jgi:hypothetical protein
MNDVSRKKVEKMRELLLKEKVTIIDTE